MRALLNRGARDTMWRGNSSGQRACAEGWTQKGEPIATTCPGCRPALHRHLFPQMVRLAKQRQKSQGNNSQGSRRNCKGCDNQTVLENMTAIFTRRDRFSQQKTLCSPCVEPVTNLLKWKLSSFRLPAWGKLTWCACDAGWAWHRKRGRPRTE